MSDKVFSDSTFTATAERYADSWNEFSTLNLHIEERDNDISDYGTLFEFVRPLMEGLAYIVIAVVLVIMLIIIYRQRGWFSGLFPKKGKILDGMPASPSAIINIFGHDYDREIADSLRNEQYDEAIRLTYLKTLYYLQRHNCISWTESKTATEYYYEYKNAQRRPIFHELTGLYLVAVYADKSEQPITKADYEHAREMNLFITKQ